MDKNLNYQQARRIRHTGFGGIFADQLEQNATVGQALKRTISLKMQSRMKGIQEKFDPLNIAKFMTLGSSWAPALLGHLTGRSHEDTRYFSGRLKPIVVKSKTNKITPLPKEGEQLVEGRNVRIGGINKELLKIYKLLKKSQETEKKRREMEHNFEEERALEDEKRHKEFIKALSGIAVGGTASLIETEKPKSLLDNIVDVVSDLGWLTKFPTIAALFDGMIPLMIGAFPMLAMWKISDWAEKADINKPDGNPIAETARAGLDFANWYNRVTGHDERIQKDFEQNKERRMREGDSWEKKSAGTEVEQLKQLAPTIQHYEKLYRESKGEDKQQIEVALNSIYDQRDALIKKIGGVDAPGERITPQKTKPTATKTETEKVSASRVENKVTNVSQASTGDKVTTESTTNNTNNSEMSNSVVQELTSKVSPVTNINEQTQQLLTATNNNMDAQLPKVKAEDNVTINNVVSSTKKSNQKLDSLSEISVRNDEPSLLRIVMDSTIVLS